MSELLDTAAPDAAPRTDKLAVSALVMGILGFLVITIPLGLVLGVVAFIRSRGGNRKGAGLALVGLALSIVWAAGAGYAAATMLDRQGGPERDARGEVTAPAEAAPDALKVGDCIAGMAEGEVDSVKAVPCADPSSEGKVYAIFDLADGDWPGETKADELAGAGCTSRYEKAGAPEGDEAEIFFLRPTRERWGLGDREVTCVVTPAA